MLSPFRFLWLFVFFVSLVVNQLSQVHTVYSIREVNVQLADGQTETIDTTDSHPFYVQGEGWVSAEDLQYGNQLESPDGQTETVLSTTSVAEPDGVQVYNFTVANDHTYFVEPETTDSGLTTGLDAAWVHNDCALSAAESAGASSTLTNFSGKVGQATDGVLGGFVKADGTVDFVPFTQNGLVGHSAAQAAGAIPADAAGGFSVGVNSEGQITGFNFNSVLNGENPTLSPALQQQIRNALAPVTAK